MGSGSNLEKRFGWLNVQIGKEMYEILRLERLIIIHKNRLASLKHEAEKIAKEMGLK